MHGSVGIIIESDHTFLFEEEEYEGNDQAIAAPAHTDTKIKNAFFFLGTQASWHASKSLYRLVDEMNGDKFRDRHRTPLIELVPLPSGAQFLNVIEFGLQWHVARDTAQQQLWIGTGMQAGY